VPHFKLGVTGISTGATAGAYITLLGLKLANTAGHRARLRRLIVGGGGGAPQDVQVSLRLRRTSNAADGTSTAVSTTLVTKADPGSVASVLSAAGKNYSAEPTTFEAGGPVAALNARGTLVWEFGEEGPVWGINQTLCLEGAPGSAAAVTLEATAEWEEF
jgi:hypothetical protein